MEWAFGELRPNPCSRVHESTSLQCEPADAANHCKPGNGHPAACCSSHRRTPMRSHTLSLSRTRFVDCSGEAERMNGLHRVLPRMSQECAHGGAGHSAERRHTTCATRSQGPRRQQRRRRCAAAPPAAVLRRTRDAAAIHRKGECLCASYTSSVVSLRQLSRKLYASVCVSLHIISLPGAFGEPSAWRHRLSGCVP